jgi:NAD(P)-dependent dehydrogenase (short-subunit alcohol dehydrogenase family)
MNSRVSVIVGGATSVGRAIAERFGELGDRVYVADISAVGIAELNASRGIIATVVDATDPAAMAAFFERVQAEARALDVLVNAVGLAGPHAALEDVSVQDWDNTLRGSVGAAFYAIRAVAVGMKQRGRGAIINFSSASTRTGLPARTPYVVAKAAVEALTRNMARELGPFGVRINAILPGAIDNERLRRTFVTAARERGISPEAYEEESLRYVSMRCKIGLAELVAMVEFLSSDAAIHVTGQLIAVDGNSEWEE